MKIKIEILTRPTGKDLADINILLTQIAAQPHFLSVRELKRITSQKSCRLVVVRTRVGQRFTIVGMASLTLVYIPTGLIAVVEDVVVDEDFRGRGLGTKLTRKLIDIASWMKAKHIGLYTNPARAAANAMYQKMGFVKKDTNYYRINLFLPKPASAEEIRKMLFKKHNTNGAHKNAPDTKTDTDDIKRPN